MSEPNPHESEIERLLRSVPFDDAPRAAHRDALREQALAGFDLAKQIEASRPRWKKILNSGREIMRRPIPRLIAVCSACLVIAVSWTFVPGHQSQAEAFNRFAAAIVAAKSARYQMEVAVEGQPKQKFRAYYLAPGRFRQEIGPMINIGEFGGDQGAGKWIMLSAANKTAMQMVVKGKGDDRKTRDQFDQLRELLAENRDAKESQYVRIGEKEIDGRRTVGFQYDSPAATITLWGDPATGNPVRIETIWSGVPRTEMTMFDFEANVPLDESLFDMTPPADYKVQTFDIDSSKPTETDLVDAFRRCAEIADGEFPDAMTTASLQKLIIKYALRPDRLTKTLTDEDTKTLMKHSLAIGRGFQFALELPESADAYYAGKGVKRDTKDRPIFWYRDATIKKYRVLYADLTVKDADSAPQIPDAQKIEKASKAVKPAAEK